MSFYSTPQVKLLFQKMKHTQTRQEVAGDNLARYGIAGEKTKGVENFEKAVKRTRNPKAINSTDPNHQTGLARQTDFTIKTTRSQSAESLSGNSIGHEQQLLALNEATTEFHRHRQIHTNMISRVRVVYSIGSGK